mmetsp:Transcript_10301/g.28315  ORF Transcript_10301/g.28315 Transcript_10301/m.28315 type:complete len:312 (+) Transcript_10301:443-1378(+)
MHPRYQIVLHGVGHLGWLGHEDDGVGKQRPFEAGCDVVALHHDDSLELKNIADRHLIAQHLDAVDVFLDLRSEFGIHQGGVVVRVDQMAARHAVAYAGIIFEMRHGGSCVLAAEDCLGNLFGPWNVAFVDVTKRSVMSLDVEFPDDWLKLTDASNGPRSGVALHGCLAHYFVRRHGVTELFDDWEIGVHAVGVHRIAQVADVHDNGYFQIPIVGRVIVLAQPLDCSQDAVDNVAAVLWKRAGFLASQDVFRERHEDAFQPYIGVMLPLGIPFVPIGDHTPESFVDRAILVLALRGRPEVLHFFAFLFADIR